MDTPELTLIRFYGERFAPSPDEEAEDDTQPALEDPATGEPVPPAPGPVEPPGVDLREALKAGLSARGWACPYEWATYRGQALDARRHKRRYDVELWLCDAETGRWELVAEQRRGLFKKLFQMKPDPEEHALLRLHIEETLEALEGISRLTPWRRTPFEGG